MTVSAHDVAAELRNRLGRLPTMKLHKLLYYCQGVHLAHVGEPLFTEHIQAWDDGPVVASLWREERDNLPPPQRISLSDSEIGTVNCVISRYGGLSGDELSVLTHEQTPWLKGDEERKARGWRGARISTDTLREYFTTTEAAEDAADPQAVLDWLTEVSHQPLPPAGAPATREGLARRARDYASRHGG